MVVPLTILVVGSLLASVEALEQREIHLAGIFPINGVEGWQGGQACEPAADLALQDVNAQSDILPGYTLKLHWDDSGCDSGKGASVLYDLLYTQPQKVLLLAGCSTVCTTVAEAAKMWNLVTVCYGASSPALSNRQRFPTLFRTHPSATVHNPTRIRVFQMFKWSKIAILQEAEEVFSTTLNDLESRTKLANITISTRQSFLRDPQAAVANLKRQDARIIVGLFYAKAARKVLCEIYKNEMYGKKYVWFFIGWYEDNWFNSEKHLKEENIGCSRQEMEKAAEGHFTTEALQWNSDRYSPTVSGHTVDDFKSKLESLLRKSYRGVEQGIMPEGYLEAPLAYDAIWAVALALNGTITRLKSASQSLDDYNYNNKKIADIILEEIADVKFEGMSGSVAFNEETGDRIAWTKIEQLQDKQYRVVGFYDQKEDNLTWVSSSDHNELESWNNDSELSAVIWPGGSNKIPQDRTIVKEILLKLNIWLYMAMSSVAVMGILIAFSLIYFNFRYGHRRIIQKSHPSSNNIMLLGIILSLAAIIPMGLDDSRFVSLPIACGSSAWLLTLGFTLAFGSMFSKIWRVHRLATKTKGDSKKRNVVPWKLWVAVGILLAIDLLLLLVWTALDPLVRQVHNFPKEESPDPEIDVEIQPQLEHCKSTHHTVWLSIMYAYKGVQLLYGLFLAYETRAVKLKEINDSRLVALAIYNVVILCMITAPVILVIGNQLNAAYCFVSLSCIFCCYLSMALVFMPKIIYVRKHSHDPREKEDDERENALAELQYRELLKANEELQRKVAEKEQRLNLLKKRLEEKKEAEMMKRDREEAGLLAVRAEINCSFNNNVDNADKQASNRQAENGLRNRRGQQQQQQQDPEVQYSATSVAAEDSLVQSAVSDMERTSSMRGITVLRGQVPAAASAANRGRVEGFGDEHVESYL